MEKDYLVIYHKNCLDGFGAAYSAWLKYGDLAEYIPYTYDMPAPTNIQGKTIFILDFSFPKEVLVEMSKTAQLVTVIDHHKKSIDDLIDFNTTLYDINLILDDTQSGCVLAWNYFHPENNVPELLYHIQDRDLWVFELQNTKEIAASLWHKPREFKLWDNLMVQEDIDNLIAEGKTIQRVQDKQVEDIAIKAHKVKLNGMQGYAVNSCIHHSSLGNILADRHNTFGVVYFYDGKWRYSIRGTGKVDVNEIAKQFGGGGHKNAAGWTLNYNLFERETYNVYSITNTNN